MVTSMFHRIREANKPDPWAMTDADIAVYDKAFVKLDKDKDGFISSHGQFVVKQYHPVLATCTLYSGCTECFGFGFRGSVHSSERRISSLCD